jgi:hypothetical protein
MFAAALICAALLMGEPAPAVGNLHLEPVIPAGSCPHPEGCAATEVYTEPLTVVFGPQPLAWQTWVHIGCHRVQAARAGWRINGTMHGPRAEAECIAVERRAEACRTAAANYSAGQR